MSFRYDVKSMFFDRQAVIDAIGRGNVKVLSRAGAFIRVKCVSTSPRSWPAKTP